MLIHTHMHTCTTYQKAMIEVVALKKEIRSLKDTIKEEKIKAEFAIDELLESSATQVMELQASHDLKVVALFFFFFLYSF